MKTLYLSYDGMTDVLGQSQVIPYLIGLSKLGHEISILSFEKKDRLKDQGEFVKKQLAEAGIKWEYELFSSGIPILPKLLDRKRMISHTIDWQKRESFQLVHCRSYVAAEAGYELKKKFSIKFLFDMRGFWVDERVEGGLWNLSNPIYKLAFNRYKKLEKKMLEQADAVVCLTKPALATLKKWGVSAEKISVIPCATDLNHFKPVTRDPRPISQLVYLGSLGTWYLLKEMLDFYKVFRQKGNCRFLFITPDDPKRISAEAAKRGIPSTELVFKSASREEVPAILQTADAGIFFIRPTFSKTASSPTKLGELMACGIPVICNSGIGDVDEVLTPEIGIVLSALDRDHYKKATEKFFATSFSAETIRKQAEKYFDLQTGVNAYAAIYSKQLTD